MPEHTVGAHPGMVPRVGRAAGTMFAALYGESAPHDWRDPDSEHDAYQLFHQRSVAMGWLDDRSAGGGSEQRLVRAPGLWAMNDAGWGHPHAVAGSKLVSWFQIEASAVADDRPLPVQPFLRCAWETTARAGSPRLSVVQLLLPVHALDPAARPAYAPVPSLQTVDWFAESDPRSRAPVEIAIHSGRGPSISAVAEQLADELSRLAQGVFVRGSYDLAGRGAVPPPPFDDSLWNGLLLHGVVLRGELIEWSCDAVGWLAEVVADTTAQLGIRTPLLLTVGRDI